MNEYQIVMLVFLIIFIAICIFAGIDLAKKIDWKEDSE